MSLFREWLLRLIAGNYVVAINLHVVGNLVIDTTENDKFMLLNFGSKTKAGQEVLFCSAVKVHDFNKLKPPKLAKDCVPTKTTEVQE